MTPELTLIVVNLTFLGFAYLWVYPNLDPITLPAILWRDAAITAASLIVAGFLFWGSGVRFNILFFNANWAVFSFITFALMELPVFAWFAKRHDLEL